MSIRIIETAASTAQIEHHVKHDHGAFKVRIKAGKFMYGRFQSMKDGKVRLERLNKEGEAVGANDEQHVIVCTPEDLTPVYMDWKYGTFKLTKSTEASSDEYRGVDRLYVFTFCADLFEKHGLLAGSRPNTSEGFLSDADMHAILSQLIKFYRIDIRGEKVQLLPLRTGWMKINIERHEDKSKGGKHFVEFQLS